MRDAPGWHRRHLDAVLDHPELLRRRQITAATEFRRAGIKPLAHLGGLHAGPEVAGRAHLFVEAGTGRNARRIGKIAWDYNSR